MRRSRGISARRFSTSSAGTSFAPRIIPAFGCHPWHLAARTPDWERELEHWLDTTPGATVGEIGLDRWMLENPDRWAAETQSDLLWLTESERKSLIPANPNVGHRHDGTKRIRHVRE